MSNFTRQRSSAGSVRQERVIVQQIILHFNMALYTQRVSETSTCACVENRWTLRAELTGRCNNSSHGESISNALGHGNDIRDNSVALKAPHVASCSPESGLDLSGAKPVALISRHGCTGTSWGYSFTEFPYAFSLDSACVILNLMMNGTGIRQHQHLPGTTKSPKKQLSQQRLLESENKTSSAMQRPPLSLTSSKASFR